VFGSIPLDPSITNQATFWKVVPDSWIESLSTRLTSPQVRISLRLPFYVLGYGIPVSLIAFHLAAKRNFPLAFWASRHAMILDIFLLVPTRAPLCVNELSGAEVFA